MSSTENTALPQTAAQDTALTPAETRRLNFLGYAKADIALLTPEVARKHLAGNARKAPKQPSKRSTRQAVADGEAKRAREIKATRQPAVTDDEVKAAYEETRNTPIARMSELGNAELAALDLLGYQAEHVVGKTYGEMWRIINTRTLRPGSRAFNAASATPIPDAYTDEAIAERNTSRPKPSGVVVALDEYTHRCIRGDDPIDAVLLDLQDRFPGERFRAMDPNGKPFAGPQFDPVYDTNGQAVQVGDLVVGRMPEAVYQEAFVKSNLKRSAQQMGMITQAAAIGHETGGITEQMGGAAVAPDDRHYAPVQGKGLTIAPQLANL